MQSSTPGASSNSGTNRNHSATVQDDDSDFGEAYTPESPEDEVYSTDPLENDDNSNDEPQRSRFPFHGFFSSTFASRPREPPSPASPYDDSQPYILRRRTPTHPNGSEESAMQAPETQDGFPFSSDSKNGGVSIDYHTEGPGRRVGYEDLTSIDWIFEYAKERQRLRVLYSSAKGILGQFKRFLDGSQIWLILIASGISTGFVAACIDVVSDWLGDLKEGICRHGGPRGGKFYLNKHFCCWGLDDIRQCQSWRYWSGVLGISSTSGSYTVEYVFFIVLSVFFALGASILVQTFAAHAKQSGIPEVKTVLGGFVMRKFMGFWVLTIKAVGLCLSVASGLWLGKEGPLIHVACCCAHVFLQFFPSLNENEARKREVLSAAAAAGISVAFGAPVGGVLFSLEQLSFYFPDKTMWQSFVCAMIAAVTLQAFNPFRTGKLVLYQVTYLTKWHGFELLPFAFLGILGGLYGGLFIKLNMQINRWRKQFSFFKSPIIEVGIFAIITALINFPNKFMRAQLTELVARLFSECSVSRDEQLGLCGSSAPHIVISNLLAAVVLGFLLTSITFGLQIPSGIILPSMAIGGLIGRTVGLSMRTLNESYPDLFIFSACEPDVNCVTAGTYAIIGAAASLAGATRMTVSIVVIMFELTGALDYVLPIMISVMISKWTGDIFGKKGIYESWINFNGYPFLDNRDDSPVPDVNVHHVMTRIEDLVVIPASGNTVYSLNQLLKTHPFRGFPVVNDPSNDTMLLGYISRTELAYALQLAVAAPRRLPPTAEAFFYHQPLADPKMSLDLRPWMDQTPITLSAQSGLQLAADMFLKLGLRYLLFCDKGVLKGVMTKKDVWLVLNGAAERRGVIGDESKGFLREEGFYAPDDGSGSTRGLLRRETGDGITGEEETRRPS